MENLIIQDVRSVSPPPRFLSPSFRRFIPLFKQDYPIPDEQGRPDDEYGGFMAAKTLRIGAHTHTLLRDLHTSKCQQTDTHTCKHTHLNSHDSGISSFQGVSRGELEKHFSTSCLLEWSKGRQAKRQEGRQTPRLLVSALTLT